MSHSHTIFRPWGLALLLGICAGAALAQPVYRIVGPDGKVTFSDRAPSTDSAAVISGNAASTNNNASGNLPFTLQKVSKSYPVMLYTSSDCAPCTSARNFLVQRGIPFTERTITSNEDITALQRLSGSSSLPFGTIGGQKLEGFSESEWAQYLDAAEYPKQSQLPPSYRRPAVTPLVAVKTITPKTGDAANGNNGNGNGNGSDSEQEPTKPGGRRFSPPTAPSGPVPSNPAGISF